MADGGFDFLAPQTEPPQEVQKIMQPARSEEEVQQRIGGWKQVVNKIASDPALQRMMFVMGAQMAQPMRAGQSPLGHVAQAGMAGLGAYDIQKASDERRGMTQREEGRKQEAHQLGMQKGAQELRRGGLDIQRLERLLPLEEQATLQKLKLLEWEVANAPEASRRQSAEAQKAELELLLLDKYGARLKEAQIENLQEKAVGASAEALDLRRRAAQAAEERVEIARRRAELEDVAKGVDRVRKATVESRENRKAKLMVEAFEQYLRTHPNDPSGVAGPITYEKYLEAKAILEEAQAAAGGPSPQDTGVKRIPYSEAIK